MKTFALLTMAVLGSTSVASADSFGVHASARASFSVGARYEAPRARYQRPQLQPRYIPSRVTTSPQTVIVRDQRTHQSWEVTPCHDLNYNVSGYYEGPAGNVQLFQRGNRIYGTFANGGQITGVIEQGKITYTWTGDGYHGRGFWYVDGRGGLIGTWGANESDSAGNWNLVLAHR